MHVLIVGYGNPLREDDGIGWAAADALRNPPYAIRHTLTIETVHQLLPELAEQMSQADLVIFIDAAVAGAPGTIRHEVVAPLAAPPGAFSHHVGPAGLLEMAQVLYGRAPQTHLFTVTAARLGYGEALSPTAAAALPALLDQIAACIDSFAAAA
ncbi:MAG: hydrogenase maturation protease [Anaerolineales bacterium]|nr:hydrogenase maturation protease [Anaerolineales bacterium]